MNPLHSVVDIDAYCRRIGYGGTRSPTLATLRAIQEAHVRSIAFENLDSLGGEVVAIDLQSVQRKLVSGGRGGYCFEQNTLLGAVLEGLGFRVSALAARVRWQVPSDVVTALGHMALRVSLGDASYLVDAGFGSMSLTAPLEFGVPGLQATSLEPCRLNPVGGGYLLEVQLGEAWHALYQFDLSDHPPPDFEVFNWYTCTSPQSTFVTSLMAASIDGRRRHTLLNNRHTVRAPGCEPLVRQLCSVAELEGVLEETMGIRVPRSTALHSKFEMLVALR